MRTTFRCGATSVFPPVEAQRELMWAPRRTGAQRERTLPHAARPGLLQKAAYYEAALPALRFVQQRLPAARRFDPDAAARWAVLRGHLTAADRIDLILRDANAQRPSDIGPRTVFALRAVAEDDPFGAAWDPSTPWTPMSSGTMPSLGLPPPSSAMLSTPALPETSPSHRAHRACRSTPPRRPRRYRRRSCRLCGRHRPRLARLGPVHRHLDRTAISPRSPPRSSTPPRPLLYSWPGLPWAPRPAPCRPLPRRLGRRPGAPGECPVRLSC